MTQAQGLGLGYFSNNSMRWNAVLIVAVVVAAGGLHYANGDELDLSDPVDLNFKFSDKVLVEDGEGLPDPREISLRNRQKRADALRLQRQQRKLDEQQRQVEKLLENIEPLPPFNVSAAEWASANPIHAGARVVRGSDWRWGDGDGGRGQMGTVLGPSPLAGDGSGWWRVEWDAGHSNSYRFGADGRYDLMVIPEPMFPGVNIIGNLPRVEWSPQRMVAETIAAADMPVVLEHSVAELWLARQEWDFDTLAERLREPLQGVKITPRREDADTTPFLYYHYAPMNEVTRLVAGYKARTFTKHNMTAKEFLYRSGIRGGTPPPLAERKTDAPPHAPEFVYSYADKLDNWGPELVKDIIPLDPLMVLTEDFTPETEHMFRQTFVWMSPPGTTTPLHFDIFQNFFVQLQGRKRFLLLPPDNWDSVYLYPLLHPGGRSSQLDIVGLGDSAKYSAQARRFPVFGENGLVGWQVEVGPGDVLYIPPMWFHQVTTIEPSISVSVWSPFSGTELAVEAAEKHGLPIKKSWTKAQRVAALRSYLLSVANAVGEDMSMAGFIEYALLENRYKHVAAPAKPAGTGPYCWDEEVEAAMLKDDGNELLAAHVGKAAAIFRTIGESFGLARRNMLLADFFEVVVNSVVGAEEVVQVLSDLVYC